jgi:2-succinyl-6-hydroxy-2,4-cyclohexadiene-1-carboxylate synthase
MIISYKDICFNVICNPKEFKVKNPIIFLHGFTGSVNDWNFVTEQPSEKFSSIFIDLIGHGKSDAPNSVEFYETKFQIELLKYVLDYFDLENVILVGYSMGGRLALSFTIKYQESVDALILESTSFGIENEIERLERIESDKKLAEQIENSSVKGFINKWIKAPLFDSLKNVGLEKFNTLKNDKIRNNNLVGLKNSLLGFSTGKMENYFLKINNLQVKTLLIVGELDEKFVKINIKANSILANSELEIIKESGHNVHFEKPKEFLKFLNRFILNMKGNK